MSAELVLTTFDWVPEWPRGYVRDLRVRWALEEAGLPYRVATTPFRERAATHYSHQPFGQVPWLTDGELSIFESGAILLHLGQRSTALLPAESGPRSEATTWLIAALNSMEPAILPMTVLQFAGFTADMPVTQPFEAFLQARLGHLEPVLAQREWLAGRFSIADIAMADALRLLDRAERLVAFPACRAYLGRATARPAFIKAHAHQLAHFAAAD